MNVKLSMSMGVLSRERVRPPVPPPATLTTTAERSQTCGSLDGGADVVVVVDVPAHGRPAAELRPPTPVPASRARSNTTTGIPSPFSRRTVAAPRPPAPPVTMADRSLQFMLSPFLVVSGCPVRIRTLAGSLVERTVAGAGRCGHTGRLLALP